MAGLGAVVSPGTALTPAAGAGAGRAAEVRLTRRPPWSRPKMKLADAPPVRVHDEGGAGAWGRGRGGGRAGAESGASSGCAPAEGRRHLKWQGGRSALEHGSFYVY